MIEAKIKSFIFNYSMSHTSVIYISYTIIITNMDYGKHVCAILVINSIVKIKFFVSLFDFL